VPPPVKVDEDLSEEVADVFTATGYEAITIRAQGWGGCSTMSCGCASRLRFSRICTDSKPWKSAKIRVPFVK
jgi:hypothetical protein